jgi:transposase
MSKFSIKRRCSINALSNAGWSVRQIAKKLKCSPSTVQKWNKGSMEEFNFERKVGSGRKSKINEINLIRFKSILKKNPYIGSRQIIYKIKKRFRITLSDRTIRRYSSRLNLVWGKARPRPTLTAEECLKRKEWCLTHRNTDWKTFIFSDEKVFRYGLPPVGMRYERGCRPNFQTVYRGKPFHIWSAIHFSKKFPVMLVPNKMDSEKYCGLLSIALNNRFREGMIFQHDNAPCHASEFTTNWLDDNDIDFEDFPPYSPDLNPIENLWGYVNNKVRTKIPKSLNELKRIVLYEMSKVSRRYVKKLIISMPHRVEQCITRNGKMTDY